MMGGSVSRPVAHPVRQFRILPTTLVAARSSGRTLAVGAVFEDCNARRRWQPPRATAHRTAGRIAEGTFLMTAAKGTDAPPGACAARIRALPASYSPFDITPAS
jgi:hypothetical protein